MLAGLKKVFSNRETEVSPDRGKSSLVTDSVIFDELASPRGGGQTEQNPIQVSTSARLIVFDLRYIISHLPDQLRGQVESEVSSGHKVQLPAALLLRKIQKGDLSISFGTLKKMSPSDIFEDNTILDHKRVELDLEETRRQLSGKAPSDFEVEDLNIPVKEEKEESSTVAKSHSRIDLPSDTPSPAPTSDTVDSASQSQSQVDENVNPLVIPVGKIKDHIPDACKAEISGLPKGFETPLQIPTVVAQSFYDNAEATASWRDFWSWFQPKPEPTGFEYADPVNIPMEVFIPIFMEWKNASAEPAAESATEDFEDLQLESSPTIEPKVGNHRSLEQVSRIEKGSDASAAETIGLSEEPDFFSDELSTDDITSAPQDSLSSRVIEKPEQEEETLLSEQSVHIPSSPVESETPQKEKSEIEGISEVQAAEPNELSGPTDTLLHETEIGVLPSGNFDQDLAPEIREQELTTSETNIGVEQTQVDENSEKAEDLDELPQTSEEETGHAHTELASDQESDETEIRLDANLEDESDLRDFTPSIDFSENADALDKDIIDSLDEVNTFTFDSKENESSAERSKSQSPSGTENETEPASEEQQIEGIESSTQIKDSLDDTKGENEGVELPQIELSARKSRKAHNPEIYQQIVNDQASGTNRVIGAIQDEQTARLARLFFQPEKRIWTTDDIIGKASLLEGVNGLVVSFDDGLIVGSRVASGINTEELGREIPSIFNQASSLCGGGNSSSPECLSIDFHGQSVHVFKSGNIFLMAFSERGASVPQKHLKFITSYLSRKLG